MTRRIFFSFPFFFSHSRHRHEPVTRLNARCFSRILSLPRGTRFVALVTTHEWLLRHAVPRGHARAVVRRLNHAEWTARRVAELRALPRYVSVRRRRTNGRTNERMDGRTDGETSRRPRRKGEGGDGRLGPKGRKGCKRRPVWLIQPYSGTIAIPAVFRREQRCKMPALKA